MQFRSKALLLLIFIAVCGIGYSQLKNEKAPNIPSTCAITLKVTGGQFSPQTCVFEIVTQGEACGTIATCPPDYALHIKDVEESHIREMTLFHFRTFSKQTFHFDAAENLKEFNGQVLDEHATLRNLLRGEVSLEPVVRKDTRVDQTVKVSFDVSFSGGIHIQGLGEVPVKRVDAP